jgi:hypothetical protein
VHPVVAQRRVRIAQVWVVVLVLGALGVIFIPTGWLRSPPEVPKAPPTTPTARPQASVNDNLPAPALLAGALDRIAPPQKEPPKKEPDPIAATDTTPPPPPPTPPVRFIGAIMTGRTRADGTPDRRAILAVNEQQKLIAQGDFIDAQGDQPGKTKLAEVQTSYVILEKEGGVTEKIELRLPATPPPMAIMPIGNPAIAAAAGMNFNPNEDAAGKAARERNQERERMIRERAKMRESGKEPRGEEKGTHSPQLGEEGK